MKFTSEDLMKAMGLQVGDRLKTPNNNITYLILKTKSSHIWVYDEIHNEKFLINYLVDAEFEILSRPEKVGDLKCDKECNNCPLRALESCNMFGRLTLYELLDKVYNDWENKDQEIYDLLKARLDKEVEE